MATEEQEAADNPEDMVKWFHDRIQVVDKKFQVPLPWYRHHPKMNSNIKRAKVWLRSTTKKLLPSGMFKVYDQEIQRQLKEGVIKYCGPLTSLLISKGHHFLPHFPVMRPEPQHPRNLGTILGHARRNLPGSSVRKVCRRGNWRQFSRAI